MGLEEQVTAYAQQLREAMEREAEVWERRPEDEAELAKNSEAIKMMETENAQLVEAAKLAKDS